MHSSRFVWLKLDSQLECGWNVEVDGALIFAKEESNYLFLELWH